MPKIIGFLFRFFPMWPKLKAVAHTLPYDLTIMADTAILDGAAKQVKGADPQPGGRAGRGDGQRVLPGQVMSISGTPERRMGRAGHQGRSQP